MRQVTGRTSTYSSDVFGICSALYELGGMVVMHDASGCNSTYTTHDEPRWYDMDSMIYISAISEMEAILGDDEKWITDLTETALQLRPKFIALILAPIPYMIGTDVEAVARIVQKRTGIPCIPFQANGMHDYTAGVSKAMEEIVRACAAQRPEASSDALPVVNLLGATPLDIPLNGTVDAIRAWVADHGMRNGVCLAMGCSLEDIARLPQAQANLVVSSGGLAAAKLLQRRFGTPYRAGIPYGEEFSEELAEEILRIAGAGSVGTKQRGKETKENQGKSFVVIGEAVASVSLAEAIERERGVRVRVLCPLETGSELLRPGDVRTPEEDDLIREIRRADAVIADPLYRTLAGEREFYPLPHTAFSGRIYEEAAPNLIRTPLCE